VKALLEKVIDFGTREPRHLLVLLFLLDGGGIKSGLPTLLGLVPV
jgi:hypothetical protein